MSLAQALNTAVAGLSVTQTALGVVAADVANARTPGYTSKVASQITTTAGSAGDGVRIASINREIDIFVQAQLRNQTSGASYADLRANFYQQLNQIYGQPGSTTSLNALFNNFTTALQTLSTTPESSSAQTGALSSAQALTAQLNSMTSQVQGLRSLAEQGIGGDIAQANAAIDQIADANRQLATEAAPDSTAAALADQRDQAILQLAKFTDIRVVQGDHNQISVFTGSGLQLVGLTASHFEFTARGTVTPQEQFNADPNKRTLDTITVRSPDGASFDLVANNGIRSGELAAYLDMRDKTLVQAQSQLDDMAARMSQALSDQTTSATAVTVGLQKGFDADIGSVSPGNMVQFSYTDSSSVQHKISVVRADDPSALPLADTVTPDPTDKVVGINFTGGMASVVTQLNAAFGPAGLQFSNSAGTTLRVMNNGPVTINSMSTTTTVTSLTSGSPQLPMFVDGGTPFTGAITGVGPQSTGFAGRISVNNALQADPSRLVVFQTSPQTPPGDTTRPNFILNQLTNTTLTFSPSTGVGSTNTPFQGTVSSFLGQVVSQQSQAANAATNLKTGQDIVMSSLQQRFNDTSAVNIDTEMARLLTLQSTYGANARVLTVVKQMLETLLQV
jgi:flagellar hook-associated protein 1 FlgK